MDWKHILDCQPENGRSIIQVDPPFMGHYDMKMRDYNQLCTFEELLEMYKDCNMQVPDFWWIYEEDFPFPDKI